MHHIRSFSHMRYNTHTPGTHRDIVCAGTLVRMIRYDVLRPSACMDHAPGSYRNMVTESNQRVFFLSVDGRTGGIVSDRGARCCDRELGRHVVTDRDLAVGFVAVLAGHARAYEQIADADFVTRELR